jgi:hypothetical protein
MKKPNYCYGDLTMLNRFIQSIRLPLILKFATKSKSQSSRDILGVHHQGRKAYQQGMPFSVFFSNNLTNILSKFFIFSISFLLLATSVLAEGYNSPSFDLPFLYSLILALTTGAFVGFVGFGISNKLKRKLGNLASLISTATLEELKMGYREVYDLYLKLPIKKKEIYYSKINEIRSKIETQLLAEKTVASLLSKKGKEKIEDKKERYLKIYQQYHQLSLKSQEKYYPKIVELRQSMEK